MNSEITDLTNESGCIAFDAECSFCTKLARRFAPLLRRHGFGVVPLQTPWVMEFLARDQKELLSEMRLVTSNGRISGGADELIDIARHIWWARPLFWIAHISVVRSALRSCYRWVAQHRSCLGHSCSIEAIHHDLAMNRRDRGFHAKTPRRKGLLSLFASLCLCVRQVSRAAALALAILVAVLGKHLPG